MIAPRGTAFDADLGRDADGRVVAVYSRCAKTYPQLPGRLPIHLYDVRCDLYEYDVSARRERRLAGPSRRATSEFLPAIDGRRLVFARGAAVRKDDVLRLPVLVSATLGRYRERELRRPSGFSTQRATEENQGPMVIDVAGGVAALGWNTARSTPPARARWAGFLPTGRSVVLYALASRSARVLEDDCLASAHRLVVREPVARRSVRLLHVQLTCGTSGVRRMDRATGARIDRPLDASFVPASQTSGGWMWTALTDTEGVTVIDRTAAVSAAGT